MVEKDKIIEQWDQINTWWSLELWEEVSQIQSLTRENTLEVLLDKLIRHFEARKHLYREKQTQAFQELIQYLQQWNNKGLIKLPMGTGKTFLFSEIAMALWIPTIILVPRVGLVYDTKEEMVWSDKKLWVGFKDNEVHTISSKETWSSWDKIQNILDQNDGEFKWVIVTTYASLNSLRKTHPDVFQILIEQCGLIVSDEAHRSLWDKTKDTGTVLFEWWEVSDDVEKDEREIEEIIEEVFQGKIHLFTTATPQLIDKDVRDDTDTIFSATLQDVAETWDLIIPKRVSVWKSFLHIERKNEEDQRFRLTEEDLSWPLDKYRDQEWNALYEILSNKYLEEKEKAWGYLPWVWFCTTVEQAEFVTNHLNSIWVRAIRCTSDKPWVSKSYSDTEAKRMLENDEVDVVVTCTKVWEWWDVPTLRASIWYTPTQSPVKNLQGNGRIMRIISAHLADIYRERTWGSFRDKNQDNTIIIEPESWEVVAFEWDQFDVDEWMWFWELLGWVWSLTTISWSHEMMYEVWELSKDYLDWEGIKLLEVEKIENVIQLHVESLQDNGIFTTEELIDYWTVRYKDRFWWAIISRILWRTVGNPKMVDLYQLWIKIWFWDKLSGKYAFLENSDTDLLTKHKEDLSELWIESMWSLLELWPVKYGSVFKFRVLQSLLGRKIINIKIDDLIELWNILWFPSLVEEHKQVLSTMSIEDYESLKKFWPRNYERQFWLRFLKHLLWRAVDKVTVKLLWEIAVLLWFIEQEEKNPLELDNEWYKEHLISELRVRGIVDMNTLISNHSLYRKEFWVPSVTKLFGKPLKWTLTKSVLFDIGVHLGFEDNLSWKNIVGLFDKSETLKRHKIDLERRWIKNCKDFLNLGYREYRNLYWVAIASLIIWEPLKRITMDHMEIVWDFTFPNDKK